ncbi:Protein bud22 [Paramyrothecium foliicola]|nr:Protein bud22 [Paramyrothecium foliicola]
MTPSIGGRFYLAINTGTTSLQCEHFMIILFATPEFFTTFPLRLPTCLAAHHLHTMPKRKRSEPSLKDKLDKAHEEVSKALKAAKGWERQRLSKRLHDADVTADKKERLEREITVLKSLDLHQTALAHLYSSLLKVKSIAESADLPDEIRAGVPKPELSEQERVALHNVTSGLYNRDNVKQAIERAVTTVCASLNVPPPSKGKRMRKKDFEAKAAEEATQSATTPSTPEDKQEPSNEEDKWDDESEFQGFSSENEERDQSLGGSESEAGDDEEAEVSMYDHLLGASSDEEEDFDEETLAKYRGKETVNLDDISLSGSASEAESGEEEEEDAADSAMSDRSNSPPAKKAKSSSDDKKRKKSQATAPARDSTFLPSLMGGYISGSESEASDIDVAPAKKRRGQRARQAIWEKKYGAKAKHLQNENKNGKGGRDQGWDMRRGAVDGDSGGRRTPWKKGIQNPLMNNRDTHGGSQDREQRQPPKITKRDDEGPLHPSWEARKKAKDSEKTVAFSGQKITFD